MSECTCIECMDCVSRGWGLIFTHSGGGEGCVGLGAWRAALPVRGQPAPLRSPPVRMRGLSWAVRGDGRPLGLLAARSWKPGAQMRPGCSPAGSSSCSLCSHLFLSGLSFLICEMKACPENLYNLRTMPGNLCEVTGASGISPGGGNRNEEINSLGFFPLSLTDRTIVADTESNACPLTY